MSLPKILLYRANRPALHFSPNDPIGSRSTGGHLEISSLNNQRTARVFIRFLAYFPEANLSSTSLSTIFWKYSKTFHQQPENIQRLFISTRKYSKTFRQHPKIFKDFWAAAINSSNQQQQSTAAINSSNQQQQPAAAINSSNQQQQSTAATSSSNQQQQPVSAINSSI